MGAFHAYDIRGVYNRDFNKDDVYRIGFFLPGLLGVDKVLVGRDVRESSPEIYEYLTKGITDAGADVHTIGIATTPMVTTLPHATTLRLRCKLLLHTILGSITV